MRHTQMRDNPLFKYAEQIPNRWIRTFHSYQFRTCSRRTRIVALLPSFDCPNIFLVFISHLLG
jgi:hypothetical protein